MKLLGATVVLVSITASTAYGQWQPQTIRTNADLRGLCAVSATVAWVSGTGGTYGRTTDGGTTWVVGVVPRRETRDFRDVKAFGENTAYLLSSGPGHHSKIFKTIDAGRKWDLQFENPDPNGFFDALAFWDGEHGIALGDPVKGRFQLIATNDGGENWTPLPVTSLPPALPNEGAFAASGTCLVAQGTSDLWFCTGGAKLARLFHSTDRGQTWSGHELPIAAGTESAGGFSIAFRDRMHGLVVGGDYRKPNAPGANAAITADGGKTWKLLDQTFPYRSCVAWSGDRWVVVGTSGSDASTDDGATWKPLDTANYNSVSFTRTGAGWAVGPRGRVMKFARQE